MINPVTFLIFALLSAAALADTTAVEEDINAKNKKNAFAQRKLVRFRFHLEDGNLYSFWVSPDNSGASRGYVAAGGPGFTGPTDTVGQTKTNPTK